MDSMTAVLLYVSRCIYIQSSALDIWGQHSGQQRSFKKQLTLRTQLYDTPDNSLDQAAKLVEQVHICVREAVNFIT